MGLNLLGLVAKNPKIAALWTKVGRLPEKRLALLLKLFSSMPKTSSQAVTSGALKNLADSPNFLEWLLSLAQNLSDKSLTSFVNNMLVNEFIEGQRLRKEFLRREGFEPPVTLVINPTMACNLQCHGCYSYKMPRKGMDYALLQRLLRDARDMGTRFITISGGEPLIYRHLFRMLEEFSDLQFMSYTNGTLIDEEMADRIAAAGNLMPAISVEGFGAETDSRRGEGVHDKVLRAMSLLRERGVMFGFSATPTCQNSDVLSSDEFVDYYIDKGALFGWMFQYLPIGKEPDLSLMSTPAQRKRLHDKTREWRLTKPFFVGDFWNDGACVGGCLSAGRYCYITPEGKVQPCTFVHFYTHDLHECTLLEVLRSRFFRAIRGQQPYSRNLLRPCKIIDNPEVLREVVKECGAKPSYEGAETIIDDPTVRAHLDQYAREWGKIADELWTGPEYQNGRSVLVPFLGRIDANSYFYSISTSPQEKQQREELGVRGPDLTAPVLRGGAAAGLKAR